MELLIFIAVIVGAFALINHGEKEKRIRIHGYDYMKLDSQRTQAEKEFILNKRQEEVIMKEFNYIQQGLKYKEQKLRIHVAENGMTDYAINEMDTCVMSLEAFEEYAHTLPTSLGSELMNTAKAEALARARRNASKVSFNGFDEIVEINNHKKAFEKLFEVMNRCKEYNENNESIASNVNENKTTENYNVFNDDVLS